MPNLELTDGSNWNLILSQDAVVSRYPDRILRNSLYEYEPIAPMYCTPRSNLLLIGTESKSAPNYWFLGAIASQFLYLPPGGVENLGTGIQAEESKKIGLNRITLIQFKDYGITPYILQAQVPHWIEDISVQVWEYANGNVSDDRPILQKLLEIEQKLNILENQGT